MCNLGILGSRYFSRCRTTQELLVAGEVEIGQYVSVTYHLAYTPA